MMALHIKQLLPRVTNAKAKLISTRVDVYADSKEQHNQVSVWLGYPYVNKGHRPTQGLVS